MSASTTPYQFAHRGNLFIVPVGPSIDEVPYPTQSFTKPADYSLWVHGQIHEPGPDLDHARMSPRLFREVRDDLTRYSPVEVTRSAIRRAQHAYVGVIDSRGTPYYFALDSRGVSVREAPTDAAWKAFDRLSEDEHMAAVRQRRAEAAGEMRRVDRELSDPVLVVTKGLRYGKKVEWVHDVPHSSWWRKVPKDKKKRDGKQQGAEAAPAGAGSGEAEKSDAGRRVFGNWYAADMRRIGAELARQTGEDDLDPPRPEDALWLALPRKSKGDDAKKAPSSKASKKQAGATGKTRYTYPDEGGKDVDYVPLVVIHDDTKRADPAELANQLNVSVRTLQHTAQRLGRDAFAKFMRSHLKRFAAKHRLDPDYWNTLYGNLVAGSDVAKSERDAHKQFSDDVKEVASAVPENHDSRFGDRKVFIHHAHDEMKRHGKYSGNLDEFKRDVVSAHRKGHLVATRADFVQAMDPKKVAASETKADGATFHFISDVKHDPVAAGKLGSKRGPDVAKRAPAKRGASGGHMDAANKMTNEAIAASDHAHKTGTPEAHLKAMTMHHQAGAEHQKATGKVNSKVALAHFDQSVAHLKAAKASG